MASSAFAAFVYVANSQTRTISSFRLDVSSGQLTPVERITVPGEPSSVTSLPIAVDLRLGVLWVSIRYEPWQICTYAIDRNTGRLTHVGDGPAADNVCYMAPDRSSRFLLNASFQGRNVAVNAIGANGVPLPPHQVIQTAPKSHCILATPRNDHVLSTSLGGDVIYQWKFDQDKGTLTPNRPAEVATAPGAGPRHLVFHPNGRFVYLINQESNTVHAYAYSEAEGTLREMQTVGLTVDGAPSSQGRIYASAMRISHDGRFLIAAERGTSVLTTLRIDPDHGTLELLEQKPAENQPWSFVFSPDSRYLCATGFLSERISVHELDRTSGRRGRVVSVCPVEQGSSWVELWHSIQ